MRIRRFDLGKSSLKTVAEEVGKLLFPNGFFVKEKENGFVISDHSNFVLFLVSGNKVFLPSHTTDNQKKNVGKIFDKHKISVNLILGEKITHF